PLPERQNSSFANWVSPRFLTTYGTPLVAGRDITADDRVGTPSVAVVNEAFARKFLNGASPLGHTIRYARTPIGRPNPPRLIVGVAADAVYRNLRDPMPATMYLPLAQYEDTSFMLTSVSISVRVKAGSPSAPARAIAGAIGDVDRDLALTFRPLADQVNAALIQERLVAMLSGFFGALALLLAGLGLYGVTSYAVSRRRTEIGIRMALGAAPGGVVRLVLGRVAILVAAGVVIGAIASVWAAHFVEALLYGMQPRDPLTFAGAAAALAVVGAVAGWLPARRASRIDPAAVLRES